MSLRIIGKHQLKGVVEIEHGQSNGTRAVSAVTPPAYC